MILPRQRGSFAFSGLSCASARIAQPCRRFEIPCHSPALQPSRCRASAAAGARACADAEPLLARIRRSDGARAALALLFACALALRILVPTGFMPTQGAHGVVISLCTGQGAVKAFLPIERQSDKHGHHGVADGPCAFAAGLGGPLIGPVLLNFAITAPNTFDLPVTRAIADLTVHRMAAPPPPALGPPARA